MKDYLQGYMDIIPQSERKKMEDAMKNTSSHAASMGMSEQDFKNLIEQIIASHAQATTLIPQKDKLDPVLYNQFCTNLHTDLMYMFSEMGLVEQATGNYERLYNGIVADLKKEIDAMQQRVDTLRLVAEGEDGLIVKSYSFDTNMDMETDRAKYAHLFEDRNGSSVEDAVIERVQDDNSLVLSVSVDNNILRDSKGNSAAVLQVVDRRGNGQNNPSYPLSNAIDDSPDSYWAEVALTTEPVSVGMDIPVPKNDGKRKTNFYSVTWHDPKGKDTAGAYWLVSLMTDLNAVNYRTYRIYTSDYKIRQVELNQVGTVGPRLLQILKQIAGDYHFGDQLVTDAGTGWASYTMLTQLANLAGQEAFDIVTTDGLADQEMYIELTDEGYRAALEKYDPEKKLTNLLAVAPTQTQNVMVEPGGALVKLTITLPKQRIASEIALTPFTVKPLDIVSVQYEQDIETYHQPVELLLAGKTYQSTDTMVVKFSSIIARRFTIVLRQKNYVVNKYLIREKEIQNADLWTKITNREVDVTLNLSDNIETVSQSSLDEWTGWNIYLDALKKYEAEWAAYVARVRTYKTTYDKYTTDIKTYNSRYGTNVQIQAPIVDFSTIQGL